MDEDGLNEVERRPWYRVLGYNSARSLLVLAGILALLFIDKALARELGSWEGWFLTAIAAGVLGVAVWDYVDWRIEKRAVRAAQTKKSTT